MTEEECAWLRSTLGTIIHPRPRRGDRVAGDEPSGRGGLMQQQGEMASSGDVPGVLGTASTTSLMLAEGVQGVPEGQREVLRSLEKGREGIRSTLDRVEKSFWKSTVPGSVTHSWMNPATFFFTD